VTPSLATAALLAAVAVSLLLLPSAAGGVPRRPGGIGDQRAGPSQGRRADVGGLPASRGSDPPPGPASATVRAVSALAGVAAWLLIGGAVGGALGVAVGLCTAVLIPRLEPGRRRRERLELIRSAPLVADLLSACLIAGVPLEHAIPVVARAIGGPAGALLTGVHRRAELGESAASAWEGVVRAPGLGGVARAVSRSSRTGAPLAGVLARSAEDLRSEASAAALAEVRATAVRAVLPLGLCLLPAFALLGIAPIVGGLLPDL
jgi:Flp pilus assembly protein TadB